MNAAGDFLIDQSLVSQDTTLNGTVAVINFPENSTYNLYCFVEKDIVKFYVYDKWFSAVSGYKVLAYSDLFWGQGTKGSMDLSVVSAKVY